MPYKSVVLWRWEYEAYIWESNCWSKKCMKPYATKLTADDPDAGTSSVARKLSAPQHGWENQEGTGCEPCAVLSLLSPRARAGLCHDFFRLFHIAVFDLMNRLYSHRNNSVPLRRVSSFFVPIPYSSQGLGFHLSLKSCPASQSALLQTWSEP